MSQSRHGVIEGVVMDSAGRALPDATVMIETSDQPHPDIAAITNDTGTFQLGNLLPGNYTLVAHGPLGGSASMDVRVESRKTQRVKMITT